MLQLGSIAFLQPWILAALLSLPILWWLLQVTPPAPRHLRFPALTLLLGLNASEETPARTPWWLLLLRLLAIALVIFGLAQPIFNPVRQLHNAGPLLLVIDDDWAAAKDWAARQDLALELLEQADRDQRPVRLLTTTVGVLGEPVEMTGLLTANEARRQVQGLQPKPWPADRDQVLAAINSADLPERGQAYWLSNGLDYGQVEPIALALQDISDVVVARDATAVLPRLLQAPSNEANGLRLHGERAHDSGEELAAVTAIADDGRLVGRGYLRFEDGARHSDGLLELPIELRNRIARLSIEGEDQAAGVWLLDERWRRRPVGLAIGGALETAQPLLSEIYYLERALEPFTELRRGNIDELLEQRLAVIVLPDIGALTDSDRDKLATWVNEGGVLLRFGGPRLAEAGGDALLPVTLRGGGRILGGVMTWDSPARLAPFDRKSPFANLGVPDDVLVNRQVLAEPTLDLSDKTWAQLADGTPLVTAEPLGDGWTVFVHTTANTQWSNLVLSGLFVDLLQRIVALSQGVAGESDDDPALPPLQTLDGFGHLRAPSPTALAADASVFQDEAVSPEHPPGYYGKAGQRRALNLAGAIKSLEVIGSLPEGVELAVYQGEERETALKPWLLGAALVLLLLDLLITLSMRGLLARPAVRGAAGVLVLLFVLPMADARAQSDNFEDDEFTAMEASLETRLAYIRTGVPEVDAASRAGLTGLSRLLQRRTSVEAGAPMGIDIETDDIVFFPLLYWPITPDQPSLSEAARQKVNHYLSHGGTVLFDQRESGAGTQLLGRTTRNNEALRRLTEGLDIPPLSPVPPDHVLTKSFYLMQDFPGRYSGGTLWIGATEGRVNDGVASVLIGSNDYASAWAVSETGRPLYAVVPGGERQRELAYRVGVNLVMYALTGNYKADQVHVPFILERLGQ